MAWSRWIAALAGGAALGAGAQAPGPMRKLSDTGLVQCVVGGAFTTACAGTGQDAEYGRDAAFADPADGRAGFRYTRICASGEAAGTGACPADPPLGTGPNEWACTRDQVTGILWELKTTDGSLRDWHTELSMQNWGWGWRTQTDLRNLLNAQALCGKTNWDMPTPTELQSIVDYGKSGRPRVVHSHFPNTPTGDNTGTPYPTAMRGEGNGFHIAFDDGGSDVSYPGEGHYARALVRPDIVLPAKRFAPRGDGATVFDRWTGLVWTRCRAGLQWSAGACTGTLSAFDWPAALAYANARRSEGWRLPNVKELASLPDLYAGMLDPKAFPGLGDWGGFGAWTSTAHIVDPGQAWQVTYDQFYGMDYWPVPATAQLNVLLVRNP